MTRFVCTPVTCGGVQLLTKTFSTDPNLCAVLVHCYMLCRASPRGRCWWLICVAMASQQQLLEGMQQWARILWSRQPAMC